MIDLATGDYKVFRFEGKSGWNRRGLYERGESSDFNICASIQPLTGNMVKLIPEHRRNTESIIIFSEERLFPSDDKEQKAADIVLYDNKRFEVMTVKNWSEFNDIPHYESIAVLQDREGRGKDEA